MVLTQTIKNCEGTTGIRNRLLRARGGGFSSLKRRGGVPSGAVQVIAIAGLALPRSTGIVQFSRETLSVQHGAEYLFTEGTVPVPPNSPALCDCVVLPSLE